MRRRLYALVFALLANAAGCGSSSTTTDPAGCINGKCDSAAQSLALHSLQLLGANVEGSTQRCKECHSLTRSGLREWADADEDLQGHLPEGGHGAARLGQLHARRSDQHRLAVHAVEARLLRRRRAPPRHADALQERLSGDGARQQRDHLAAPVHQVQADGVDAARQLREAHRRRLRVGVGLVRAEPARARDGAARGDAAGQLRRELDARARRPRHAHEDRGLGRREPRPRHVDVRLRRRHRRALVPLDLPAVDRQGLRAELGRQRRHAAHPARPQLPHHLLVALVGVGPLRRRRRRQGHRPAAEPRDPRRGVVRPGLLPGRLGLPLPGHVASAPASATSRC